MEHEPCQGNMKAECTSEAEVSLPSRDEKWRFFIKNEFSLQNRT